MATTFPDDAATPRKPPADRLQGLPARAVRLVRRGTTWIDRGEFAHASRTLDEALTLAPTHPEILRLRAIVAHSQRQHAVSLDLLRRAAAQWPDDAPIQNNLGSALAESGDMQAAAAAFKRTCDLQPELAPAWFNLGRACNLLLRTRDAEQALARCIVIEPNHVPARVLHAGILKTLGRVTDAEAELREALRIKPDEAEAWAGLAGITSMPLSDDDLKQLDALHGRGDLSPRDRVSIDYARAIALETHGRLAEAFDAFCTTNASKRSQFDWSATVFRRDIDAIENAFAKPMAQVADRRFGQEVIFLVGLPRSGSTLTEQILSAHPEVTGAGEIDVLGSLLREESKRRGSAFPAWAGAASATDWRRLGNDYLQRTARWRETTSHFTDKSLINWQTIGAVHAMLPGASIIDCRRDVLETCWSCFRHQFEQGQPFTCDFDELAAYWSTYDHLMDFWNSQPGISVYRQHYEALLADPQATIRQLLSACNLTFDPACLRFHEVERDVRTASADQVRSPLRHDTARAARYGSLLDPLRAALSLPIAGVGEASAAMPRSHRSQGHRD